MNRRDFLKATLATAGFVVSTPFVKFITEALPAPVRRPDNLLVTWSRVQAVSRAPAAAMLERANGSALLGLVTHYEVLWEADPQCPLVIRPDEALPRWRDDTRQMFYAAYGGTIGDVRVVVMNGKLMPCAEDDAKKMETWT